MSKTTASLRVEGLNSLKQKIASLHPKYESGIISTLNLSGAVIIGHIGDERIPVDLAGLRNSGRSEVVKEKKLFRLQLTYGGAAAPYAEAVHEHPSDTSPPSWRDSEVTFSPAGTGPKYLELGVQDKTDEVLEDLASAVRKVRV